MKTDSEQSSVAKPVEYLNLSHDIGELLTPTQAAVLKELARYTHDKTGESYPSVTTIALKIGRSSRSVNRAKQALQELKLISWTRRGKEESNLYQLDLPTLRAWKTLADALAAERKKVKVPFVIRRRKAATAQVMGHPCPITPTKSDGTNEAKVMGQTRQSDGTNEASDGTNEAKVMGHRCPTNAVRTLCTERENITHKERSSTVTINSNSLNSDNDNDTREESSMSTTPSKQVSTASTSASTATPAPSIETSDVVADSARPIPTSVKDIAANWGWMVAEYESLKSETDKFTGLPSSQESAQRQQVIARRNALYSAMHKVLIATRENY